MSKEIETIIEQTTLGKLRWRIPPGRNAVYQCENSAVSVIVSCCMPSDVFMIVDGRMLQYKSDDLRELCAAISEQIRNRKKQDSTAEDEEYLRRIVPVDE